jgi:hypothetical protein
MSIRLTAKYQGKFEATGKPCEIHAYNQVIRTTPLDANEPSEILAQPPMLQLSDGTTITGGGKGRYTTSKGDVVTTADPKAP